MAENRFLGGWFIRILSLPDGKEQVLDLFDSSEDVLEFSQFSREELLEGARQMPELYERISEIVALPPDEVDAAKAELRENVELTPAGQKMADGLTPAITSVRGAEAAHQTRIALFQAAIAVQLDGPEALERDEHADPYGDGPFSYEETESGFVLESSFGDKNDNPVLLTVGRP